MIKDLCIASDHVLIEPIQEQNIENPTPDTNSDSNWQPMQKATLQGLDKSTARVLTVTGEPGQIIQFGSLKILVRSVRSQVKDTYTNTACFLEIFEQKPREQPIKIFSGWMFSSDPTLNCLEHPVYDVWVARIS